MTGAALDGEDSADDDDEVIPNPVTPPNYSFSLTSSVGELEISDHPAYVPSLLVKAFRRISGVTGDS